MHIKYGIPLNYTDDVHDCIKDLLIMVNKYKKLSIVRKAKINLKEKVDKLDKCRHCDEGEPAYCEKCYQDLITKNMSLQMDNINLRNELNTKKYNPYQPIVTLYSNSDPIVKADWESFKEHAAFQQERADEINTGKVR